MGPQGWTFIQYGVLKTRRDQNTDTQIGEILWDHRESMVMLSANKERGLRENKPCWHFDVKLLVFRARREQMSVVWASSLWCYIMAAPASQHSSAPRCYAENTKVIQGSSRLSGPERCQQMRTIWVYLWGPWSPSGVRLLPMWHFGLMLYLVLASVWTNSSAGGCWLRGVASSMTGAHHSHISKTWSHPCSLLWTQGWLPGEVTAGMERESHSTCPHTKQGTAKGGGRAEIKQVLRTRLARRKSWLQY
jgi:hypothetical protein